MWYGSAMPGAHRLSAELRRSRWRAVGTGALHGLAFGVAFLVAGDWAGLVTRGRWPQVCGGWAAPQDEITRRDFAIGGFKPPPRWEVLPRERRSYPQLLAWASRGEGAERSVITLVGKRLPRGATLTTMIEEASVLRDFPRAKNVRVQSQFSVGWTANQRVQLDALLTPTKTQRAQALRQLIYMNAPFAYVLTLVCPQEQATARYRDLDDTATNLTPLSVVAAAVIASPPVVTPPPPPPSAPVPSVPSAPPRPEPRPDPSEPPVVAPHPGARPAAAPAENSARTDGGVGVSR